MDAVSKSFVAECFWPDVHEHDVRELDERIRTHAAKRDDARFLGSVLIRADEVVLFHLEGTAAGVHDLAERAGIPFERLLETDIVFSAATNSKGESDA
ncbi:MAG TPA: hypothetical protein VF025_02040 [Gaiellaceae bacterium]